MTKPLILLFGHENSPAGQLSDIAISRCDTVLELSKENQNAVILSTGAFGSHFNVTDFAHSTYLNAYLVKNGVEADRILQGTNSSNTLEDILCARKVIVDGQYGPILIVTSEYHVPRVSYILRQVFRSINFRLAEAKSPIHLLEIEQRKERLSFAWLKRNWVSPPIYELGSAFPNTVYEAANSDQKHYDTVSLAAVTGAVFVTGLVLQSGTEVGAFSNGITMHVFALLIILVLSVIYERCAASSRTARRSMRLTEIAFDVRGFSSSYDPNLLFRSLPSIQTAVRYLFVTLLAAHFVLTVVSGMDGT